MEEVTKCSYIHCLDTEENGRIFHELPICDTALCVKWLINSGHEDLIGRNFNALRSIKFFVCSNHFTNDSYIAKGTLKENAVPWPHWKTHFKTNYNLINKKSNQCLSSCIAGIMDKQGGYTNVKHKKRHKNSLKISNSRKKGNSNEWCRTCAVKKPNLVNMTVKTKNTEMSLLSKLKLLIEIDDEDTLPLNMCSDCVIKLEQSFQFFQQIYVADNTLRQIFPKRKLMNHGEYNGIVEKVGPDKKQRCDVQKGDRKTTITPMDISVEENDTSVVTTEMIVEESISPQVKSIKSEPADNTAVVKEETVFSLLTDTCHSDEELDWTDVLDVMKVKQELNEESKNSGSETSVQCKYCQSKFELRPRLRKHILEEHPNFVEYLCIDCITCYNSKTQLLEHRAQCHGEQKYQCDYCKKPFGSKVRLTKHIIRFHLRGRNYLCSTCNKRFLTKQNLCEHMKNIHRLRIKNGRGPIMNKNTKNSMAPKKIPGKKGRVGYRCKLCSKLFVTAERLAVHLKTHSIRDWESYKAKVFHCGECAAKRFSMEKLRIHEMKCHLAKRQDFVCLLCETKSFNSAEEYSRHISLHCKRFKIINPLS